METNKELIDNFLYYGDFSKQTFKIYRHALNTLNHFLKEKSFLTINTEDLNDFINSISTLSKTTIVRYKSIIISLYNYLMEFNYVSENPALKL